MFIHSFISTVLAVRKYACMLLNKQVHKHTYVFLVGILSRANSANLDHRGGGNLNSSTSRATADDCDEQDGDDGYSEFNDDGNLGALGSLSDASKTSR